MRGGQQTSRSFGKQISHRLVRVTALNAMILQRSPPRWQHPATQVRHRGDGPGLEIGPQLAPGPVRPIESADRSTAKEWMAPARLLESGSTYRLVIVMERNVEEERAHSNPPACPAFALRQHELPAAARKSELPLSRFPRGKAGAGGFPPRRWHAAPPARGVATYP